LIHPADWEGYQLIKDYDLMLSIGWPFDTTQAMCRLVFGGIFDRYPKLKIVVHHLGGVIPYLMGRLQINLPLTWRQRFKSPKQLLHCFKLFYADTAVNGWRNGLRCGYSFFGPDRTIFATDYPFGPGHGEMFIRETIASIGELPIREKDKLKIFDINARKLLHLEQ
jgi:aminocarboxymuconate-semialdehyde decarboxylase